MPRKTKDSLISVVKALMECEPLKCHLTKEQHTNPKDCWDCHVYKVMRRAKRLLAKRKVRKSC